MQQVAVCISGGGEFLDRLRPGRLGGLALRLGESGDALLDGGELVAEFGKRRVGLRRLFVGRGEFGEIHAVLPGQPFEGGLAVALQELLGRGPALHDLSGGHAVQRELLAIGLEDFEDGRGLLADLRGLLGLPRGVAFDGLDAAQ